MLTPAPGLFYRFALRATAHAKVETLERRASAPASYERDSPAYQEKKCALLGGTPPARHAERGRAQKGDREAATMATKAQVERAIFEREGFRVEFEPFAGKRGTLPPYNYIVMAPQRWKVSDWKNARLEPYRLLVKRATVFRGDGTPIDRDTQLGNLRDTYYEDTYGPLKPAGGRGSGRQHYTPF